MFQPANGHVSMRERCYSATCHLETGAVITWQMLPIDEEDARKIRRKVSDLFELRQKRHLKRVPGVGWKIVAGVEHYEEGVRDQRRANRQLRRTLRTFESVDRREMSGEQQLRLDQRLIAAARSYERARRESASASRLTLADVKAWQEQQRAAS